MNGNTVSERITNICARETAFNRLAFRIDYSPFGADERRNIVWNSLREELQEPKCHHCLESDGEGACGWAYVQCEAKDCGETFCAGWFNKWYVS